MGEKQGVLKIEHIMFPRVLEYKRGSDIMEDMVY